MITINNINNIKPAWYHFIEIQTYKMFNKVFCFLKQTQVKIIYITKQDEKNPGPKRCRIKSASIIETKYMVINSSCTAPIIYH